MFKNFYHQLYFIQIFKFQIKKYNHNIQKSYLYTTILFILFLY